MSVAGFLCDHAGRNGGSTRSLRALLSQLRVHCRKAGQAWLSEADAYLLKRTVGALEYADQAPYRAKEPATLAVLLKVIRNLQSTTVDHALFALTLLLGHNGLLRAAELHSGFRVRDLIWDWRDHEVHVPLKRTKTLRRGPPEMVTFRKYRGPCAYDHLRR